MARARDATCWWERKTSVSDTPRSVSTRTTRTVSAFASEFGVSTDTGAFSNSPSLKGSVISGGLVRRDCSDASRAMRRQRSTRFSAAIARCFSVRRAITGTIVVTFSSVHFSIAHSMRSNLKIASNRAIGAPSLAATSSLSANSTRSSVMLAIAARRTRSPQATSNSCPIRARRVRDKCAAWAPVRAARSRENSSAIQRRRVIE